VMQEQPLGIGWNQKETAKVGNSGHQDKVGRAEVQSSWDTMGGSKGGLEESGDRKEATSCWPLAASYAKTAGAESPNNSRCYLNGTAGSRALLPTGAKAHISGGKRDDSKSGDSGDREEEALSNQPSALSGAGKARKDRRDRA